MESALRLERYSYADRTLQRRYISARREPGDRRLPNSERIFEAYYMYLCRRKARLYRLSGVYNLGALISYVSYAAGKLLDLAALRSGHERGFAGEITVKAFIGHEHVFSDGSDAFLVGRGTLGGGKALGTSSTEAAPRIDMWIELRLRAWQLLMKEKRALSYLIAACDFAVPLTMSFRIYFSVHRDDWSFALGSSAEGALSEERQAILGVTTGLGSG